MSLEAHVDPELLVKKLIMENNIKKNQKISAQFHQAYSVKNLKLVNSLENPTSFTASKTEMPEKGLHPKITYQLIHDDLDLDGNPTLNLASFVNTYVPDEAKKLIKENITKNFADNDEYPISMDIHKRCISILSSLWHAPDSLESAVIGSATTGSSEAIMLGGLALKKRWQKQMKAAGKSTVNPNILMGANAQVALEKFARYFDVEARIIPVSSESEHLMDISKIEQNVDENTIGIFVILGSTYTGGYENVYEISRILDRIELERGINVPIHVDGASGAMISPFVYPNLIWDFKIPRVYSINTSGHKFGLTSAGLGWIVWRAKEYLPKELIFQLRYLGGLEESFTLNFSRTGYQVIHQYFNFLCYGKEGYKKIFNNCLSNARLLSKFLEESGYFECVSSIHRPRGICHLIDHGDKSVDDNLTLDDDNEKFNPGLPVVAFKFSKQFEEKYPEIPQSMVSTLLRNRGFIVPNYPLPKNEQSTEVLRIVVRYNLNLELLDKLMSDIIQITEVLIKSAEIVKKSTRESGNNNTELIYDMLLSVSSGGFHDKMRVKPKL
ncbi:glutamate decarboxylase [Ascoidea rubescens DSM 1968]|uniref:Glutamate decarboxylase n=1 Tax=Ascoidea rubescens DSM 1968 TaxID=1344418 RepID=A0A1D2VB74_9ASCO|nr:glutamate decarboxylase [Ascoidea rubescens DSM 1968]ODV58697.1 glutamate decarboxylase [Ascoidea rubescens DSM 1968]